MKGRKPKSATERKLSKNAGKKAHEIVEPVICVVSGGAYDVPLTLPPYAQAKWREYMPRLKNLGLLKETDLEILRLLCLAIWMHDRALKVIETEGFTYVTESKHGSMTRERPEVGIMQRAAKDAQKLMEQLGMTSVSRVRTYAAGLQSRQLNLFPDGALPASPSYATQKNDDDPVNFINRTIN